MAEPQPSTIREGATTGDVEDELQEGQQAAKSAEDRKAAAALASLDASGDAGVSADVDAAAVSKAMKNLGGASAEKEKKDLKKVKVDAADVALLVDELDLTKPKATELLKSHDGDAVAAMKAFIST
ncbi:hypothetical protein F5Y16DRAFT_395300 [Xylariaceae sp. FL0255]|nr:hypothetical protein F5Y16DRAFT_395300 [Xylariaceae sp. FL0255]